jgi:hypothetical protein
MSVLRGSSSTLRDEMEVVCLSDAFASLLREVGHEWVGWVPRWSQESPGIMATGHSEGPVKKRGEAMPIGRLDL